MSISATRTKIIELLNSIKASIGVDSVYYDVPTVVTGTPAIAVIVNDFKEESQDNCSNSLTINYVLRIMLEKVSTDTNDTTTTTALLTIVDSVMAELRKKSNTTLSGDCYDIMVSGSSNISVGSLGDINVFYTDITISVRTIKNIC